VMVLTRKRLGRPADQTPDRHARETLKHAFAVRVLGRGGVGKSQGAAAGSVGE
jgi:hypothetical protein